MEGAKPIARACCDGFSEMLNPSYGTVVRLDPGASRPVLTATPELYEPAAVVMNTVLLVRLVFGVLVMVGLYLT